MIPVPPLVEQHVLISMGDHWHALPEVFHVHRDTDRDGNATPFPLAEHFIVPRPGAWFPLDSKKSVEACFEWFKSANVTRVYWRGLQNRVALHDHHIRDDNALFRTLWDWYEDREPDTTTAAAAAAKSTGIKIFGVDALFDRGGCGDVSSSADMGFPYESEDLFRIRHPAWIPVDRWGERRHPSSLGFHDGAARDALIERWMRHLSETTFDGLYLYTYSENMGARYANEFGFEVVFETSRAALAAAPLGDDDAKSIRSTRGLYLTTLLSKLHDRLHSVGKELAFQLWRTHPTQARLNPYPNDRTKILSQGVPDQGLIDLDFSKWTTFVDDFCLMDESGKDDPLEALVDGQTRRPAGEERAWISIDTSGPRTMRVLEGEKGESRVRDYTRKADHVGLSANYHFSHRLAFAETSLDTVIVADPSTDWKILVQTMADIANVKVRYGEPPKTRRVRTAVWESGRPDRDDEPFYRPHVTYVWVEEREPETRPFTQTVWTGTSPDNMTDLVRGDRGLERVDDRSLFTEAAAKAPSVLAGLLKLATHPHEVVRRQALFTLLVMSTEARGAEILLVSAFEKALTDDANCVRVAAAVCLRYVYGSGSAKALFDACATARARDIGLSTGKRNLGAPYQFRFACERALQFMIIGDPSLPAPADGRPLRTPDGESVLALVFKEIATAVGTWGSSISVAIPAEAVAGPGVPNMAALPSRYTPAFFARLGLAIEAARLVRAYLDAREWEGLWEAGSPGKKLQHALLDIIERFKTREADLLRVRAIKLLDLLPWADDTRDYHVADKLAARASDVDERVAVRLQAARGFGTGRAVGEAYDRNLYDAIQSAYKRLQEMFRRYGDKSTLPDAAYGWRVYGNALRVFSALIYGGADRNMIPLQPREPKDRAALADRDTHFKEGSEDEWKRRNVDGRQWLLDLVFRPSPTDQSNVWLRWAAFQVLYVPQSDDVPVPIDEKLAVELHKLWVESWKGRLPKIEYRIAGPRPERLVVAPMFENVDGSPPAFAFAASPSIGTAELPGAEGTALADYDDDPHGPDMLPDFRGELDPPAGLTGALAPAGVS